MIKITELSLVDCGREGERALAIESARSTGLPPRSPCTCPTEHLKRGHVTGCPSHLSVAYTRD